MKEQDEKEEEQKVKKLDEREKQRDAAFALNTSENHLFLFRSFYLVAAQKRSFIFASF